MNNWIGSRAQLEAARRSVKLATAASAAKPRTRKQIEAARRNAKRMVLFQRLGGR